MSHMRNRGYPVSLAVFTPIGQYFRSTSRRQWDRQIALIQDELGLEISRLPSPPSRAAGLWKPEVLLRHWLQWRYRRADKVVLHCRGPRATELALNIRRRDPRLSVVFDCRGWEGAEYLHRLGYERAETAAPAVAAVARKLHQRQERAAVESDFVLCVSQAMKRTITDDWPVDSDKIEVVPCCAEIPEPDANRQARETTRRELGLEGKFVIVYSGSLAHYQMPGASLRIVKTMQELRPDAFFLGITTDPSRLRVVVDEAGLHSERNRVISVPHQEVPRYLAAADAGLLIRDASIVNRVASPVKFAEYLACGVPVLLTGSVGDYSELVHERGLGAVLPDPDATQETMGALIAFLGEPDHESRRQRCREVAVHELSWESTTDRLAVIYDRLEAGSIKDKRDVAGKAVLRRQKRVMIENQ